MKRILIAGIVGGLIMFAWGVIANALIPLHTPSLHNIPNEDAVVTALQTNLSTPGVYLFPGMPADRQQSTMDAYIQKYKRGPLGMIIYRPDGADPFMAGQMITGLIIAFLSAILAAWFLSRSTAMMSKYLRRVIYCGMLGIFISVFANLNYWNWYYYPLDYTTANIADTIIGWLLAGLGIGAIIKLKEEKPA
jgi:hypothetical protein